MSNTQRIDHDAFGKNLAIIQKQIKHEKYDYKNLNNIYDLLFNIKRRMQLLITLSDKTNEKSLDELHVPELKTRISESIATKDNLVTTTQTDDLLQNLLKSPILQAGMSFESEYRELYENENFILANSYGEDKFKTHGIEFLSIDDISLIQKQFFKKLPGSCSKTDSNLTSNTTISTELNISALNNILSVESENEIYLKVNSQVNIKKLKSDFKSILNKINSKHQYKNKGSKTNRLFKQDIPENIRTTINCFENHKLFEFFDYYYWGISNNYDITNNLMGRLLFEDMEDDDSRGKVRKYTVTHANSHFTYSFIKNLELQIKEINMGGY